jgi:hypothetical protein
MPDYADAGSAMQKQKTCQSCGKSFLCGPSTLDGKCWCSELPHIMQIESGKDCLCQACLEKEIDRKLLEQKLGGS